MHYPLDSILKIPTKTFSTWNGKKNNNYRLFLAVMVENLHLIYFCEKYKNDSSSISSNEDRLFVSFFIQIQEEIRETIKRKNLELICFENDRIIPSGVEAVICDFLSEENIGRLNIWAFNGIATKKNVHRRREYLTSLMYLLLVLPLKENKTL